MSSKIAAAPASISRLAETTRGWSTSVSDSAMATSMRGTLAVMSESASPRTWYVLLHTRGRAVAEGQSVFEHPGIAEHYAFLQRRVMAGELVAAGPLPDEPGNGMTVLAVPDLDTANRLATQDDQAVVNGILDVQVRPWHVVMARGD
jgi:uncharacterized protein YciI